MCKFYVCLCRTHHDSLSRSLYPRGTETEVNVHTGLVEDLDEEDDIVVEGNEDQETTTDLEEEFEDKSVEQKKFVLASYINNAVGLIWKNPGYQNVSVKTNVSFRKAATFKVKKEIIHQAPVLNGSERKSPKLHQQQT